MSEDRPTISHMLHRLDLAGAEVLATDRGLKLQDRFAPLFLCLDGVGSLGQRLRGEGIRVIDLQRKPGVDFRLAWRLRNAVRRHGIDLLHAHQYTPFFYAAASRAVSVLWGRPIFFTEHSRHYPDRRKPRHILANFLLLRPEDRIIAVGQFVSRMLIENEDLTGARIAVVYNGVDIDPLSRPAAGRVHRDAAQRRAAVRRAMGVGGEEPVVLQVARFHPVKDHQTALRALAQVMDHVPAVRLVLGW